MIDATQHSTFLLGLLSAVTAVQLVQEVLATARKLRLKCQVARSNSRRPIANQGAAKIGVESIGLGAPQVQASLPNRELPRNFVNPHGTL